MRFAISFCNCAGSNMSFSIGCNGMMMKGLGPKTLSKWLSNTTSMETTCRSLESNVGSSYYKMLLLGDFSLDYFHATRTTRVYGLVHFFEALFVVVYPARLTPEHGLVFGKNVMASPAAFVDIGDCSIWHAHHFCGLFLGGCIICDRFSVLVH